MAKAFFGICACLTIVCSSSTAFAQDVPQQTDKSDTITVEGSLVTPKTAQTFVTKISTPIEGQFSRFPGPVCPQIGGVEAKYADVVAARIRKVAAGANVPVADAPCDANLIVMIVPDVDKTMTNLRNNAPGLFVGVAPSELQRALKRGPVRSWTAAELVNEDGQGMSTDSGQWKYNKNPEDQSVDTGLKINSVSIIRNSSQRKKRGFMMVIDDDATLGKTLSQIADYVAIRALTGARAPEGETGSDTILTLFDSDQPARGATALDRSYLKAFYEFPLTAKEFTAKGEIARRIVADARARAGG